MDEYIDNSRGCLAMLSFASNPLSSHPERVNPFSVLSAEYAQCNLGAISDQWVPPPQALLFSSLVFFFGRELVLVGVRNRRSMSLFHNLSQSSGISFDPIHRHLFWFDKLPRGVIPHAIFIDWIDLLHSEIVAATGFEVDCQALYSVVIQIGVLQLLVRWWKVPRITAGEHEENFETVWFVISWMTSASIVPG